MKTTGLVLSALFLMVNLSFGQDYEGGNIADQTAFGWPEGKKMALSLSFDDARFSQVDKGIPLLNSYGVTGTFYVSPAAMLERVGRLEKCCGGRT